MRRTAAFFIAVVLLAECILLSAGDGTVVAADASEGRSYNTETKDKAEIQAYGTQTARKLYTENIALASKGTKASANIVNENANMVKEGYTVEALNDGKDSAWSPSYMPSLNSKAEDDIVVQLDFPGWYTMNNLALMPRIEGSGEDRCIVGFPEDFTVSVHSEDGWRTVLTAKGYTAVGVGKQSFDFNEIKGDALRLHVTRIPRATNVGTEAYVMYLTEMYVYGMAAVYSNVIAKGDATASADSTSTWAATNSYTADKLVDNRMNYGGKGYFSGEYTTENQTVTIDVDLKDFYKVREIRLYPYWTDWDMETPYCFPVDFTFYVKTVDGWTPAKQVTGYTNADKGVNSFALDAEYECDRVRMVVTRLPVKPGGKTYVMSLSEIQVIGCESALPYIEAEEDLVNVSCGAHCVAGASQGAEADASAVNDESTDTLYTGNSYTTGGVPEGEYILTTLDRPARINEITIGTNKKDGAVYGFPTDFRLRVYNAGTWTDVVERRSIATSLDQLTFTFEALDAERVELLATGLSETEEQGIYALQITELSVFGRPTATKLTADLNLDYRLDEADLQYMRKVLLKEEYLVLKGADVNSDSQTDIRDLAALLKQREEEQQTQESISGVTYYVDSAAVSDGTGLTPEQPLCTLEQVNALSLQPGDRVLLKRGSKFHGSLIVNASGTKDQPILIGAYGEGALPVIHGDGTSKAAVYGENVSYITVKDLEVTNAGDTAKQHRGIYFIAKSRSISGITIEGCYVHNVDSLVEKVTVELPGLGDHHWTGGILVRARSEEFCDDAANLRKVTVNDVLIQNNRVEACAQTGIMAGGSTVSGRYPSLGICIRGNYVGGCYGDGIIVMGSHGAVLEGNVSDGSASSAPVDHNCAGIWVAESSGTLFQYNESRNMKENNDGQGFDVDNGCTGTLLQYNYSHDNYGGALLLMQKANGSVTIRYNISQNDGRYAINVAVHTDKAPYVTINAHHNIVYTDASTKMIAFLGNYKKFAASNVGSMSCNIFYGTGQAILSDRAIDSYLDFDGNIYYQMTPSAKDRAAKTADPQFADPGGAGDGILSLSAYVFESASPYADSGFKVPVK